MLTNEEVSIYSEEKSNMWCADNNSILILSNHDKSI